MMRNTRQNTPKSRKGVPRRGINESNGLGPKRRGQAAQKDVTPIKVSNKLQIKGSQKKDTGNKLSPRLRSKRTADNHVSTDEDTDDDIPKKKNKKEDLTARNFGRPTRSKTVFSRSVLDKSKDLVRSSSRAKSSKDQTVDESDDESNKTESVNGAVGSRDSEIELNKRKPSRSLGQKSQELDSLSSTQRKKEPLKQSPQRKTRRSLPTPEQSDNDEADEDSQSRIDFILDDSDDDLIFEGEEISDDLNDDDVINLGSDVDSEDDDDGSDVIETGRSNVRQGQNKGWGSAEGAEAMELRIVTLQLKLDAVKTKYEKQLQEKEDSVKRLENELKWKDEQLSEMEKLSNHNIELESRVNLMLSNKENYEKEVKRVKEAEEKELKEKEESKRKEEEQKKLKEERKEKKEDNEKRNNEKPNDSETEEVDEDGKLKKKRRQRRLQKKKEETGGKDEIDAYFVDDDSDIELIEEEKAKKPDENPIEPEKIPEEKKSEKPNDGNSESQNDKEKETNEDDDDLNSPKGRHNIRKMMTSTKLQDETKLAAKAEKERIERAKKEHDKHLRVDEVNRKKEPICKQLALAMKKDNKTPLVEVNSKLIKKLKPHQVDAVEFIWDNVIESMDKLKQKSEGAGCILAHCMGLGKTLSVITVVHTLLTTKSVGFKRALIVCPLNTVLNWEYEWDKWLDKKDRLQTFELASARDKHERYDRLQEWKKTGGIMIMGYQLFRIFANYSGRSKRTKKIIQDSLIDPGPDVVVCDEGHILKNDASAISKCMSRIKSKRRIVLTGTPLQNNLTEYHCMVNFVKPNLLGSRREFGNRFVNPITNGQHSDSTAFDVKIMKRRAHILHAMLDGCVQRRDYTALTKFLPSKHEYVIAVRLSELQIELYAKYLELHRPEASLVNMGNSYTVTGGTFKVKGAGLFSDYQSLMRIWTHPWQLKLEEARQDKKPYTEDDDDELESIIFTSSSEDEIDDGDTSQTSTSQASDEVIISSDEETDTDVVMTPRRSSRRSTADDKEEKSDKVTKSQKTQNTAKADNENKEEVTGRRSLRHAQDMKDDDKNKKIFSKNDKRKKSENEGSGSESSKIKKIKSGSDDKKSLEETVGNETRKAKVIAGEVIKQWQTQSRGTGKDEEFQRKHEDPWWYKFVTEEAKTQLELSGKLVLMFEILRMAETIGDKVLIFSQSLLTLDIVEDFLGLKDEEIQKESKGKNKLGGRWEKDVDYCRMDGSTLAMNRRKLTESFNDMKNKRMRLFLISTKAGGLGINLDSANRVIIFDASWNPSHDIQSIFRVYRFGQEKDVFIYRLVAQGTMEEKIYERQVTKETLSQRVIDEHQIDRHFSANDLRELYIFKPDKLDDPDREARPTPAVPKDVILAELLSSQKDWIVQYHEHDSLLENRPDENLSEEERQNAWEEYEREKRGIGTLYRTIQPNFNMPGLGNRNFNMSGLGNKNFGMPGQGNVFNMYSRYGTMMPMINTGAAAALPSVALPSATLTTGDDSGKIPFLKTLPGYSANNLSTQIAQLPKVVQEIIKYNPSITSDELSKRLQAFLGMHNRYGQVPGHAMGPQGPQTVNISLPGYSATTQSTASTSSLASSQGITRITSDISSTLQSAQNLANALAGKGSMPASSILMPSRLPMPGSVPANRK